MVIQIKKDLQINFDCTKFEIDKNLQKNINLFWEEMIKQKPTLWNGESYFASDFVDNEKNIIITCKKSSYSHYLYDEKIVIEDKRYWCSCIWGGILLKTSDDFFVLGEMSDTTSYPGCLQIPGGQADKLDFENNKLNWIKLISRELKEEFNLDLDNKDQIKYYETKYLELPEGSRHAYGVIALGKLNMTKAEMESYYLRYKKYLEENNEEIEFGELKFLPVSDAVKALNILPNPKRVYLEPLLKLSGC